MPSTPPRVHSLPLAEPTKHAFYSLATCLIQCYNDREPIQQRQDIGMDPVTNQRNTIESAVFRKLRPLGFTRHGSTLHRFVSGDISQVIHFQCGPARRNSVPLLSVNIGIRIPECAERWFFPVNASKDGHLYLLHHGLPIFDKSTLHLLFFLSQSYIKPLHNHRHCYLQAQAYHHRRYLH